MNKYLALYCLLFTISLSTFGQLTLTGIVIDSITKERIAFVSIGIKEKNIGTSAMEDGTFTIQIPKANQADTLTFSIIGYKERNLPLKTLYALPTANSQKPIANSQQLIALLPSPIETPNVMISAGKLKEKKIGVVKYNPIGHFLDGSIVQNDIFEIAQLVKFGKERAKVLEVNLYITDPNKDSGTFRINFYGFDKHRPTNRIVEKTILQRLPINEGWLKFDVSSYNIYLTGNVVVGIEFIPTKQKYSPIHYELKLGGFYRSFVRKSSLGTWTVPPHHYRMYVTALITENKEEDVESEIEETPPTFRMYSKEVKDSFSIFVQIPNTYKKNEHKQYPIAYVLDGNVYFDNLAYSLREDASFPEMILVGIGYKDFFIGDSLRDRDFTYPKALLTDSFHVSGGACQFLAFIQKELIPYIDRHYRTDTLNRTLMGHSLGGYFTLFALTKEIERNQHYFHHFVSASPSLDYCENYIVKKFQRKDLIEMYAESLTDKHLLITTEGLDQGKRDEKTLSTFSQLIDAMNELPFIKVESKVYENFEHMETAIPTFEKGLKERNKE